MVEALIWVGAVFSAGSLLILERRCLGQMAVVQPLVLCLVAGLVTGQQEIAIWLGIVVAPLVLPPLLVAAFIAWVVRRWTKRNANKKSQQQMNP